MGNLIFYTIPLLQNLLLFPYDSLIILAFLPQRLFTGKGKLKRKVEKMNMENLESE